MMDWPHAPRPERVPAPAPTPTPTPAKGYREGSHRACPPEETFARFSPLASRLGLTRLSNITGLDVIGLPVWVATRPNSRGLSTAQGKGLTDIAAKTSAMMEAIEGWHGEHMLRPVRVESLAGMMAQATVVDVRGLAAYHDPAPRQDQPLAWIEGYDLLQQRACWVPLDCVSTHYSAVVPAGLSAGYVQSSNGLASGNHRLEALVHAIAEVIERDAVARTAAAVRSADPAIRIDPTTVTAPALQQVLEKLRRAGLRAALYDISSELGIPACACTIVEQKSSGPWRTLPAFNGYGAHLCPDIALMRAITEAVQSRLTYICGSRDDIGWDDYLHGGHPDDLDAMRRLLDSTQPAVDQSRRRSLSTDSFEDDLAVLLGRLRWAGVESAVAVDLTHPGIGVPVCKVVVPRLLAPAVLMRGRAIHQGETWAPPPVADRAPP